jgi:acetyltransferase-like isoleucine patch superfamily enzyme
LGAKSTIRCGVTIGEWAMVGSGSVVTRDLPNHALAFGNPARVRDMCAPAGSLLRKKNLTQMAILWFAPNVGVKY